MEVVTRTAASQLGVSQRQVQRAARNGHFSSRTVAGRTVLDSRSIVAASRSAARGRRWNDRTVGAAVELLERGATERLVGSQRSRLRARLREIDVSELAYQVLGDRVSIWRSPRGAVDGPGGIVGGDRGVDGFSTTGEGLSVKVVRDSALFVRRARLLEDLEGDLLVFELDTDVPAAITDIVLYAFGDVRTSSAARGRIVARQSSLQ